MREEIIQQIETGSHLNSRVQQNKLDLNGWGGAQQRTCACARTCVADRQGRGSGRPEKTRSGCWSGNANRPKIIKREKLAQPVSTFSSGSVGFYFTVQVTRCRSLTLGVRAHAGPRKSRARVVFSDGPPSTTTTPVFVGPAGGRTFPSLALSFACVAKLWSRGSHCARPTVAPFVGAGRAARPPGAGDDFMEKKVFAQITSLTLSCELPALCEGTTDKLCREGLLCWVLLLFS